MKKVINVLVAGSFLSVAFSNVAFAEEKSGAFAGVHLGLAILNNSVYLNNKKEKDASERALTFNAGIQAGYQYFFVPLFGVRGYLGYDFDVNAKFTKQGRRTGVHNITLNFDGLVNFINSDNFTLGAFLGFGLGYGIVVATGEKIEGTTYNGFNIPINVGLATTFGSHKIEIGGKIQTLAAGHTLKLGNQEIATRYNPHTIYVGYSYIF
ncbi:outer membrane beta-barrel protein [Helicobacter aurati]|uniref:Outer membrane beta-barrel protein n=1 Tax=Helicobacter aurati TaxID=137778 RepID=A0A3D8J0I0_9HELI|nr:outer membrane beta-barrel protein [Helicobacter aurati]RDU70720.1 outer membrane beta-barrel protein [Helicobacter aurati]